MQEILRIADSDEASLTARIERALPACGGEPIVSRFTLWYTTRPPVHLAVLRMREPEVPDHSRGMMTQSAM
jgi:hypothetical protein